MATVSVAIPADVALSDLKQVVAYLNAPEVATLTETAGEPNRVTVEVSEKCVSFLTCKWKLTIGRAHFFGASISHTQHLGKRFPAFCISFGVRPAETLGYGVFVGPYAGEAWYRSLQTCLNTVIPGGVAWLLP